MFNRWKDILYDLTGQIARIGGIERGKAGGSKRALVVRLDEIGDYMLWRPVMRHMLFAQVLEGKEITLCGNASWRSLYEQLDNGCFLETSAMMMRSFWLQRGGRFMAW